MKKYISSGVIICCFLFRYFILFSQTTPTIQWQNTIGGNKNDNFALMIINSNGNFVIGGASESDSSYDKTFPSFGGWDYWLVEIDPAGQIIWQTQYGGNLLDALTSLVECDDHGFLIGGYAVSGITGNKTDSSRGSSDFWAIKTDSAGNIQWQKTIGGFYPDQLYMVIQTNDGGYLLGGSSMSTTSGEKSDSCRGGEDYWIIKISGNGIIQWQKTIGGNQADLLRLMKQTPDGGYLLGGGSLSDSTGDKTTLQRGFFDYWVVKIDSFGNILWQRSCGGIDLDDPYSLELTPDNGFIIGGGSYSGISGDRTEYNRGNADMWVIKADSIGNIQWQKAIGGNGDDVTFCLSVLSDGYLIGGISTSDSSGEKTEFNRGPANTGDYWIIKTDSTGIIQWQKTLGGNDDDQLYDLKLTSDGGFLLGGISGSPMSGEKTESNFGGWDYWIIKLLAPLGMEENKFHGKGISVNPNPANQVFNVKWRMPAGESILFNLYDSMGRLVLTKNSATGEKEMNISTQDITSGLYFWKVSCQSRGDQNGKVVILR